MHTEVSRKKGRISTHSAKLLVELRLHEPVELDWYLVACLRLNKLWDI